MLAGSRALHFGNLLTCIGKLAYVRHAKRPLVGSRRPQTAVHMRRRSDVQASAPPRNRPSDLQRRTLLIGHWGGPDSTSTMWQIADGGGIEQPDGRLNPLPPVALPGVQRQVTKGNNGHSRLPASPRIVARQYGSVSKPLFRPCAAETSSEVGRPHLPRTAVEPVATGKLPAPRAWALRCARGGVESRIVVDTRRGAAVIRRRH